MPRQRLRDLWMHSAGGKVADEGVPQGVKVSLSLGVIGVGKEIRFLAALEMTVSLDFSYRRNDKQVMSQFNYCFTIT